MKKHIICALACAVLLSGCAATADAPPPDGTARPVLLGTGAMIWRR